MTVPLIEFEDGLQRRFEIAAPPAQARALLEQAVRLTGGTVLQSRAGGFDFAPHDRRDPARGSIDLAPCHGGTACLVRVGWPAVAQIRFIGVLAMLAAAALPLAARLGGPLALAGSLTAFSLFGIGRYLVALGSARVALRYLALVARALASSTLYRAAPIPSVGSDTRRLIVELCTGRLLPSDFSRARRRLLAGL